MKLVAISSVLMALAASSSTTVEATPIAPAGAAVIGGAFWGAVGGVGIWAGVEYWRARNFCKSFGANTKQCLQNPQCYLDGTVCGFDASRAFSQISMYCSVRTKPEVCDPNFCEWEDNRCELDRTRSIRHGDKPGQPLPRPGQNPSTNNNAGNTNGANTVVVVTPQNANAQPAVQPVIVTPPAQPVTAPGAVVPAVPAQPAVPTQQLTIPPQLVSAPAPAPRK